jgi:ubiquitin carboxyl-terminal hydrolase 8
VNKAVELQITADKLYDYLKMYNILLIDVRSREEFDSGHIYVGSVMCIEPSTLREGTSAEELLDRLVLSPDEEQAMYDRRHEYDVVVYYDESTKTSAFLTKHSRNDKELALKRLFDTLHEFNAEKPLQRPPIFLMGGIDAWTDLFGSHSLRMSTTAALVQSGQTRPTRAIKRVPAASHTAKANLQRRRIREYNPMDPEEAHAMREEARRGRSVLEQPIDLDEEDETESPLYRTQEDFLRRFPAVDLEQQSMMYPPSRPLQPPQYAPPPPPMHSAPSRPAPSVPRVSYSGVHERQVAPQGRTAQVPIYIPPGRYNSIRLHKTGLINFGVTCYMNSIIQCLCANVALSGIFLTGRWKDDVQKHNWKGTDGILPEAYATLISNLFKGDVGSVRPSTFRVWACFIIPL